MNQSAIDFRGHFLESLLVAGHELKRIVCSARAIIFFVIYALFATLSAAIYAYVEGALGSASAATSGEFAKALASPETYGKVLSAFMGEGAPTLDWLMHTPPFLLFFYKMAALFMPLLVTLTGFDIVSAELEAGSLRYVIPRAHRGSVILGKALAQTAAIAALTTLLFVGAFVFACASNIAHFGDTPPTPGSLFTSAIFLNLTAILLSLPYIALTTLFSALTKTPLYALILNFCTLFGLVILGLIAGLSETIRPLRWALPATYESRIFTADWSVWLSAAAATLFFAVLFLAAGILKTHRADM